MANYDGYNTQPQDRSDSEDLQSVPDLKERLLRVSAELENLRKRTARQIEEERRAANIALIENLLPVVDGLQHALDAAEIAADSAEMIRGMHMIYQQLLGVLEKHHCYRLGNPGEKFDPFQHEAVKQIYVPDEEPGTVVDVLQPGFKVYDRVLRPAKVIVAGEQKT
jgi:molecular chaperone GrpE